MTQLSLSIKNEYRLEVFNCVFEAIVEDNKTLCKLGYISIAIASAIHSMFLIQNSKCYFNV